LLSTWFVFNDNHPASIRSEKFLIHNLELQRRITKIESDAALKATIEVTAGAENEATLSGEPWN
jgi:hypothetical protein